MLKNKFKWIAIVAIIVLFFTIPMVRADNETVNQEATSNETATQGTTEDTYKKQDVYLTGDDVVIDYIIDGNLFVLANSLTIQSQIGGDVFVCANEVTIGEQGYIYSNLFAFSNTINIHGIVYDLFGAAQNIAIDGYVYRDIRTTSNTISIHGMVGRNAYIQCSELSLASSSGEDSSANSSVIAGNLNYSSKQEATIPEGSVSGEVHFENQDDPLHQSTLSKMILSLGTFVITILAIWLIGLWLAPEFIKNSSLLSKKKLLPVLGLGILTPIVLLILSILFLVLELTFALGILLFVIFFVLMAISTSIFIIAINNLICHQLKITNLVTIFGSLMLTSIVFWLIGFIPYVSSIVSLLAIVIGFGILVYSLLFKKQEEGTK